jgi:hypothetical protein
LRQEVVAVVRTSLVLVVATVLAALCLTASASAATPWYWNTSRASFVLYDEGLQYSDGFQEVYDARCYGFGRWLPSRDPRKPGRLWQHFHCRVTTDAEQDYWITLNVRGRYTWGFAFWRWAQ